MRRDALIVAAALVGALLLALVGYEALRWDDSVRADDARFASSPLAEGLWEHDERLPLAPTRALSGSATTSPTAARSRSTPARGPASRPR